MTLNKGERLIVALDYSNPRQACELAKELSPLGVNFKIGLELFLAGGPTLVEKLASRYRIFLDLKFHDIPNTVGMAVKRASALGVWMLNIHAAGGRKMMLAAREALEGEVEKPFLLAVTVLTSLKDFDLNETGYPGSLNKKVCLLSKLAAECGLDGVICSPLEIGEVKKAVSPGFITLTPGVRPAGGIAGDQARLATPAEVIRQGGDYLVVGRPITRAGDPLQAAEAIIAEMEAQK